MNMIEKHLKGIKKSESGNPQEDEGAEVTKLSEKIPEKDDRAEVTTLGEKLPQQIMEDVLDRSVIIQRKKIDNIEKYHYYSKNLKDLFKNTSPYSKFIKKHIS